MLKGDKRSKKREARDERYGFGGRKRLKKQNDATSAANMEGCAAWNTSVERRNHNIKSSASGGKPSITLLQQRLIVSDVP